MCCFVYLGTVKYFSFPNTDTFHMRATKSTTVLYFPAPSYFLPLEFVYSLELILLEHRLYFLILENWRGKFFFHKTRARSQQIYS